MGKAPGEVREILRLRDIQLGVVDTGLEWVQLLSFGALHYELLGPEEQRQVIRGLLSLAAGLDFPLKIWASNRPLAVRTEVERLEALAGAWAEDEQHAALAVVCRGVAGMLAEWSLAEVPERHLYAAVWVGQGARREAALQELDRRTEQVRRFLEAAIPGCAPHVLGTAEVLQCLHAFWQKSRHVRTHAETLGEHGETALLVTGGGTE